MLKRLLVLVVMIGLLFVVSTAKSASAGMWANCSCAMVCSGGSPSCQANCEGDSFWDVLAAAAACCQSAREFTPIECNAN